VRFFLDFLRFGGGGGFCARGHFLHTQLFPPLYTSNITTNDKLERKAKIPCSLLNQDLVTRSRSARAFFTYICRSGHVPDLYMSYL
jgi:hypothetical protein